jgi:hypothetical protein
MRRAPPSLAGILFASSAILAPGCAYKQLAHQPGLTHAAHAQAADPAVTPNVSLVLHARYLQFGKPLGPSLEKWWAKQQIHLRKRLEEKCAGVPFLKAARWDAPDAAYRIVLETTFDTRGSKARYAVTEFSKYLIPSSDEGVVWVVARLYRKGALLREYEAQGTYRTRRHLIFALLPMLWHSKVPATVAEDTVRDVFLEIAQDAATLFKES